MNKRGIPPHSIRPLDGRFGAGPSLIRAAQLKKMSTAPQWGTSHRKAPVMDIVRSIQEGISELFSLPDSYEIVLGNGGATAFWSIATVSLIHQRAQMAAFGEFGSKFAADAASAPWLTVDVSEASAGSVAFVNDGEGDVGAYPHNETSTGATSPLYRTAQELTLVDATSIAGASVVDLSLVDAYYFSPQKCFGSDGGLWVAILSPAAVERAFHLAEATDRPHPGFLDLKSAIVASRKAQTVNTPAIGTLLLLNEQVQWMLSEGGLPAMASRAQQGASLIQAWAENRDYASLFVDTPQWRSPVITTVDLDESIPVTELASALRDAGIVDIEGYRGLGRNQLRIASFPSIATDDIQALLDCLDWVIGR